MGRLEGKTAVIVGGATGIGAAVARRIAAEGAKVLLGDINETGAQQLAKSIKGTGGIIESIYCDQSQEQSVQDAMKTAQQRYGRIDCVLMNACDTRQETLLADTDIVSIDMDVFDHILRTSLRGYAHGARHAIPIMLKTGGGSIVFTSSEFSITSDGSLPATGIAKAGINQLVRHVAARFGREGIRCNAVIPGYIETELSARYTPAELRAHYLKTVCASRLGHPEDIAAEVTHLFSDDSAFINGQGICVNGGSIFR